MDGRRVRDQETKLRKREERHGERLEKLEKMVFAQHEKLDKLEGLMYRSTHRDRPEAEDSLQITCESPNYEEDRPFDPNHQSPPSELPTAGQDHDEQRGPRPDRTKPYYSISSVWLQKRKFVIFPKRPGTKQTRRRPQ
jgi:hypothetical protein